MSTWSATAAGGSGEGTADTEAGVAERVDELFERSSTEHMTQVEIRARCDIDDKQAELRTLVGDRYRDLIDSADSILAMRTSSERLMASLHSIRVRARALASSRIQGSPTSVPTPDKGLRRHKYILAQKIKFLVDTPEQIWSALDKDDFFAATKLYLDAESVYSLLCSDKESASLLASIPLLGRQWTTIEAFPRPIRQRAAARLRHAGLSSHDYCGALASLVVLGQLSGVDALSEFMQHRAELLRSLLTGESSPCTGDHLNDDQPNLLLRDRLCAAVSALRCTLAHVLDMFVVTSDETAGVTMFTFMLRHLEAAQRRQHQHQQAPPHPQPSPLHDPPLVPSPLGASRDWRRAQLLEHTDVQNCVSQWVRTNVSMVRECVAPALRSHVHSARGLADVARAVSAAAHAGSPLRPDVLLEDWEAPSTEHGDASNGRVGTASRSTQQPSPVATIDATWTSLCQELGLPEPSWGDMWTCFFRALVVDRAKDIVGAALGSIDVLVQADLGDDDAMQGSDEGSNVGKFVWDHTASDAMDMSRIKRQASCVLNNVHCVVRAFDTQLQQRLQDMSYLLRLNLRPTPSPGASAAATSGASPSRAHAQQPLTDQDVTDLRLHMEQMCYQVVEAFMQRARSRVQALWTRFQELGGGRPTQAMLDKALFVGRLCHGLATASEQLPACFLGPDEAAASHDRASGGGARAGDGELSTRRQLSEKTRRMLARYAYGKTLQAAHVRHNPRMIQLRRALGAVEHLAAAVWAWHAPPSLADSLTQWLRRDNFRDPLREQGWDSVAVQDGAAAPTPSPSDAVGQHDDGRSSSGSGSSIRVPLQPSHYVLSFLFTVCAEVDRSWGHRADVTVVALLLTRLCYLVTEAYADRLAAVLPKAGDDAQVALADSGAEPVSMMNREGCIQVLFDVRFLLKAMAGARLDPAQSEALITLQESPESLALDRLRSSAWLQQGQALVQRLQGHLDPIDVAFFGPRIEAGIQQTMSTNALLLSPILSLMSDAPSLPRSMNALTSRRGKLSLLAAAPPLYSFSYLAIGPPRRDLVFTSSSPSASPAKRFVGATGSPSQSTAAPDDGAVGRSPDAGKGISFFRSVGQQFTSRFMQ